VLCSSAGSKRSKTLAMVVISPLDDVRMTRGFGCDVCIISVPSLPLNTPFLTVFSWRSRYSGSNGSRFSGGCSSKAGLTRTFFRWSMRVVTAPSASRTCVMRALTAYSILLISGARSSIRVPPQPANVGSPREGGSCRWRWRSWSEATGCEHDRGSSWLGKVKAKAKL